MSRKTVVFEREVLYKEVWAEPVRTVATRNELSDVGLRKICQKLGVPLPPLGYWARVAAGKLPRVIPLGAHHDGQTRYVREIHVDDHADERATRVQALVNAEMPAEWPKTELKESVDNLLPVVRRTGKSMGVRPRLPSGLLEARGDDVFLMQVSDREKERALKIADAVLSTLLKVGSKIVPGKERERVHVEVLGSNVDLVIEEELTRSLREPTITERAKQARESWYKPDLVVRTPNGKLKLSLLGKNRYNPLLTARCGVATPLEKKLDDVVPRLLLKLIELRVDDQIQEEERERWKREWARKQAQEDFQQAQLDRLKKTRKFAKDWRRASELREYATALEKAGSGPTAAAENQSLEAEVAWIRKAANWLDPLVQSRWEAVDGQASDDTRSNAEIVD